MAVRAELRCAVDGKGAGNARSTYTLRAAMLRDVGFTVRDLVRQEP
jgi:hypothetical protein